MGVVNPRRGKVLMSIVRVRVPPILISRLISDTDRARPVAEVNHEISRAEFIDASKEMLSRSLKNVRRHRTPNVEVAERRRWLLHDERKGSGSLEIPRHMG